MSGLDTERTDGDNVVFGSDGTSMRSGRSARWAINDNGVAWGWRFECLICKKRLGIFQNRKSAVGKREERNNSMYSVLSTLLAGFAPLYSTCSPTS